MCNVNSDDELVSGTSISLLSVRLDLESLTPAVDKLLERISRAIGIVYEPTGIRRKAKAEADAEIIHAKAMAEVSDIERHALNRVSALESRRQDNIEQITRLAIEQLPEEEPQESVDEDWVFQFFQRCQDVSNEQMQIVWAKLLAGEVARPGSFSLRALNTVSTLRERDAKVFTAVCSSVWEHEGRPRILSLGGSRIFGYLGVNYESIIHLQCLGLVVTIGIGSQGGNFSFKCNSRCDLSYHGQVHSLEFPPQIPELRTGKVDLSDVGRELYSISGASPCEQYRQWIVQTWRKRGIEVAE